ncbi:MAG: (d)CMP kinase [Chthonomonadales bacterium]|nr:(d)CMP kinase [Chthonomonadales bacterium]
MKVAIDGPAGAGKSTVARQIASRFGLTYVDTGAMYRALALACIRRGVGADDVERVASVVEEAVVDLDGGTDGPPRVLLNGEDVTEAIRTPEVTRLASPLSALPVVRRALVARQRAIAQGRDVVMEGRDIASVVLPDADVKVYLTASPSVRAARRCRDLEAAGYQTDPVTVEREIVERDRRDSTRQDSPLVQTPDAVEIVSDDLTVEQVVDAIARLIEQRLKDRA